LPVKGNLRNGGRRHDQKTKIASLLSTVSIVSSGRTYSSIVPRERYMEPLYPQMQPGKFRYFERPQFQGLYDSHRPPPLPAPNNISGYKHRCAPSSHSLIQQAGMNTVEIRRLPGVSDEPALPALNVVFIHGLGSSADTAWTYQPTIRRRVFFWQKSSKQIATDQNDIFWPEWLIQDRPQIAVHMIDYPADKMSWNAGWPIEEAATAILDRLIINKHICSSNAPIIFICHSLGGLVIKQLIINANNGQSLDDQKKLLLARVYGVVFIATPHDGSTLATLASALPLAVTDSMRDLAKDSSKLMTLSDIYRDYVSLRTPKIQHRIYYEKENVGLFGVVPPTSADPGLVGATRVPIGKDHIQISKLQKRSDHIYEGVLRLCDICIEQIKHPLAVGQTGNISQPTLGRPSQSTQHDDAEFLTSDRHMRLNARASFFHNVSLLAPRLLTKHSECNIDDILEETKFVDYNSWHESLRDFEKGSGTLLAFTFAEIKSIWLNDTLYLDHEASLCSLKKRGFVIKRIFVFKKSSLKNNHAYLMRAQTVLMRHAILEFDTKIITRSSQLRLNSELGVHENCNAIGVLNGRIAVILKIDSSDDESDKLLSDNRRETVTYLRTTNASFCNNVAKMHYTYWDGSESENSYTLNTFFSEFGKPSAEILRIASDSANQIIAACK